MKFLMFENNSLSTLAEVKGKFKWENLGCSARSLKLSDLTIARGNQITGKTSYVLPISNESTANDFVLVAQQYGVTVQIVDVVTAQAKKDGLLAQIPKV